MSETVKDSVENVARTVEDGGENFEAGKAVMGQRKWLNGLLLSAAIVLVASCEKEQPPVQDFVAGSTGASIVEPDEDVYTPPDVEVIAPVATPVESTPTRVDLTAY